MKALFVAIVNHNNDMNEISDNKCGTLNTEFVPCIQKEIPDQIFYDCCKLYVESAECHELCRYGTNRDLLEILREKKCFVNNISSVLHCASQNRDNLLYCRQFGLTLSGFGIGRRCLRMCDPYRFDIHVLRKYDFVLSK
ncbi:hypothetical protein DINM_022815 [Dirofilaria immitis]|nr:hypothetical protein [Dirofilaria immitis]